MIADISPTGGIDVLRENDSLVESLQTAVKRGEFSLDLMPSLITRVVREDRWRRRYVRALQREAEFRSFAEFVSTKTPEGLGASLDMLKRMCQGNAEALDALDRAMEGKPGAPEGNLNASKTNNYNIQHCLESKAPTGTSSDAAIRRLRRYALDTDTGEVLDGRIHGLYERVLAGDLSPHAAAIEAGFRKRMLSIPVEDAERAARSIRANASPEFVRDLIHYLKGGG